jgi:hypothetical protein
MSLKVYGLGGTILNLTNGNNRCVFWNVSFDPARTKTWGAVKSLYR